MSPLILLVVTATVTATTSRWHGDVIVTEAEVRDGSGTTSKVVQLGGSVGGLGMTFSHQPPLVREGDTVMLDDDRIVSVSSRATLVPADGNATYGVQRTAKSRIALWHASGCIELTYDATTITPQTAHVLDIAFSAWSTAAASCGHLVATSTRRASPPAVRDQLSTVRIRRDRWCNPGNALEPEVCYAKDASAVTRLLFIDDPSDRDDGRILDADIELNGVDYVLLAPGETAPATTKPVLDLQAVATHEAGHALGLAHNCGTGEEAWPTDHAGNPVPACTSTLASVRGATMYYAVAPGDTGPRTVESTDAEGVCELARTLSCESYVTGGCRADRGGTRGWLVLVTLLLVSAFSSSADRGARSRRP